MIAQDPTLFTGTIRFNLDPFREYSNAAIEQLLLKAGLAELLAREPEQDAGEKEDEQTERCMRDLIQVLPQTLFKATKQLLCSHSSHPQATVFLTICRSRQVLSSWDQSPKLGG